MPQTIRREQSIAAAFLIHSHHQHAATLGAIRAPIINFTRSFAKAGVWIVSADLGPQTTLRADPGLHEGSRPAMSSSLDLFQSNLDARTVLPHDVATRSQPRLPPLRKYSLVGQNILGNLIEQKVS
ncbi:hypothetical protein VTH06DRAFT_8289 [Thermothelomyces fergusii]